MGIQCRLVMNLVTLPIRPSQNDLCSLKQKKSTNENKNKKTNSNKTKTDKKINNNKTKLKSKKKYSETEEDDDSSYTSFSENNDDNKNIKNKKTKVKQKKDTNKQQTKINEKSCSSKKDHHNTDENKNSNVSVNTRSKKINIEKLKNNPNCNDKQNDIKSTKSINLDKLKSAELSDNKNKSTKETIKILKTNKEEKCIKSKSNEKNKIFVKLPENQRITRSKSKSPFPDNIDINSINTRNRKKIETSSGTKQNQIENAKKSQRSKSLSKDHNKKENKNKLEIPQLDGANDIKRTKKSSNIKKNNNNDNNENGDKQNKRKVNLKKLKVTEKQHSVSRKSDTDDEFVPTAVRKPNIKTLNYRKVSVDKRVLSTDNDDDDNDYNDDYSESNKNNNEKEMNKKKMNVWIEVFSELEEQWITIDLFKGKVHCVGSIRKSATQPIAYVFAWNNNNTLKDVSPRYCPQWNTATRKLRVDEDWLFESIRNYIGKKTSRDKAEDIELQKIHLDKPLPTTISEYKNHPLYVLQRHLLKFEVIYPPDAPTLGFIRGEPVYARECVHVCHSRDIWLKQARVVKPGETPYKVVKSRPKWDRMTQSVVKDQPLEIFGYWQTMQYDPPTAENGIVPRNAYGNVELFKKCMLPKKTVHLRLPGLNKICKKLNIDCAPAVIGFDFHQGVCHPLLDGFVVCEEYQDEVIDAWNKEKQEAERKEREKYLQRVYGNWKKLFRGLLNKQRLERKYGFSKKHTH